MADRRRARAVADGLIILVASAWTTPASLPLFLLGAAIAGIGGGAIIGGSLRVVIAAASADARAGSLATYFTVAASSPPPRCLIRL